MSDSSRRDFLKLSTAALASAAVSSKLSAVASATSPSGEVRAWSTYGTRRFAPESALRWQTGYRICRGRDHARSFEALPGDSRLRRSVHRRQLLHVQLYARSRARGTAA